MLVNVGKLMSHTSTKGGGGVKHPFNPSLVDAWFMSGLSNADKPGSITGVMGNEMILKNFAFTSESGFGEGNYEGALVFDGIDDYGICTGLPIMTDYTVICRRIILTKPYYYYTVASKSKVANEGAFVFEIIQDQIYNHCHSFGANNRIDLYNGEISWQTKDSYNGNTIKASNGKDSDHLFIGRLRDTTKGFLLQGAIYYFALYNKSLTPEEVEEEKVKLENYWEGGKNELA